MAGIHEILQAVLGMQQNAQAALPVIPNNGNPAGANNMPAMAGNAGVVGPTPRPSNSPGWLNASPSMEVIRQMLGQYGRGNPMQAVAQPPHTMGPGITMPERRKPMVIAR